MIYIRVSHNHRTVTGPGGYTADLLLRILQLYDKVRELTNKLKL